MAEEPEDGRLFWVLVAILAAALGTGSFVWAVEEQHRTLGAWITIPSLIWLLALARKQIRKMITRANLAMVTAMFTWLVVAYLIYDHYQPNGASLFVLLGIAVLMLLGAVFCVLGFLHPIKNNEPSKLVINWANYRAVENAGETYQVGDFLRQIISGNSLVFDIENHNFVIGDKNFVPKDPLPFKEKRLQVNYSYGGGASVTTERREHGRLLLPEDSKIKWLTGEIERLETRAPSGVTVENPLSIIAARWGIGGDAFKDVTEIVRSHITSGAVRLPASRGLFGDPYPHTVKNLDVTYLVARQWTVSIREDDLLALPEKDGEEQSRKFVQDARERLKKIHDPEDDLILKMTGTEYNVYSQFKANFGLLPWSQKIALNKVCSIGAMSRDDLIGDLTVRSFAAPEFIVAELIQKGFLELHRGMLEPPATKARWMGVLFDKIKLC